MNQLFYGDCLTIMRDLPPASVDLIYLDPPFSSNQAYNAIYKDETGRPLPDQIEAFCDLWNRPTVLHPNCAVHPTSQRLRVEFVRQSSRVLPVKTRLEIIRCHEAHEGRKALRSAVPDSAAWASRALAQLL